jgi:hypothetical protein
LDCFFPYWPIISISTFLNSLWFNFIIISGDAKSNLKCKYVIYDNFILIQNLSCVNMVYEDLIFSRYLYLFKRCLFRRINIKRWFNIIFIVCFMDEKSSVVPSSIYCNFCFLRFLFLVPTSLSCFRLGINSFVTMLPFFFRDFNSRWSICS